VIRVPAWGSPRARYVLVGEAPGETEERLGQGFVGAAGFRLSQWWSVVGLKREDFVILNVCEYRPSYNNIEAFDQAYLEQWMSHLHQRIAALEDPWVIIPTGNYALYALTGKGKVKWHTKDGKQARAGIVDWRGSILQYSDLNGRVIKVIPTIHPAATFRQPDYEHICIRDWQKIAHEGTFRELNLPTRTHHTRPTLKDLQDFLLGCSWHVDNPVAVDVENPDGPITVVGFSADPFTSLSVDMTESYWGTEDLPKVWELVKWFLEGPVPKILHYGLSDSYKLALQGVTLRSYQYDTLYMHHCFTQETRVLMSNCQWKKIMDIRRGDEVLGFDEFPTNGRYRRHLKASKVTKVSSKRRRHILKVVLDNGEVLRGTPEHNVLVGCWDWRTRRRAGNRWKALVNLDPGDEVYSVGRPWDTDRSFEGGWVAGAYDGEGSIGVQRWGSDRNDRSARVGFSQKAGLVLEAMKAVLTSHGFDIAVRRQTDAYNIDLRGGLPETLRFLGVFPTVRLLSKFVATARKTGWNGFTALRGVKVVRVEQDGGAETVYDISTRVRTFIANGVVVHNCLDPSDWHALDYCASRDTREPFWKAMAKDMDQASRYSSNWTAFLNYNGLDVCVTRELYDIYRKRLEERGMWEFYLRHYADLLEPLHYLQLHGVLTDDTIRRHRSANLTADCIEIQDKLEALTGIKLYGEKSLSTKKLQGYLYDTLGLPKQQRNRKERGEKTVTADEVAVRRLILKYPSKLSVTGPLILTHKRKSKLAEFYQENRVDADGRYKSSYSMNTEAGRLSSSKTPLDTGGNAQNTDREARDMFVADKGCIGVSIDGSQVEARICYLLIYMLTNNKDMYDKAMAHPDEYDQHTENASYIFNLPTDQITKEQRYLGKKAVHGAFRDMQGAKLSDELMKDGYVYEPNECQRMINAFKERVTGIDELFRWVRRRMLTDGYLENSWGRRLYFFREHILNKYDNEAYRRGYSFDPQSECADWMNQFGLKPFFHYLRDESKLAGKVIGSINVHDHDALFFSVLPDYAYDAVSFLVKLLETERKLYGATFSVPCEVQIGRTRRGDKAWKRLPMRGEFEEAVKCLLT
jgi:uracil-DNA glycosylase family 4